MYKEDVDPYCEAMDQGGFHQAYKMYEYIRTNEVFNPLASFIRQNPGITNIVQRAHQHYWSEQYRKRGEELPVDINQDVGWVRRANRVIAEGGHLVLTGKAGAGKTMYLRHRLAGARVVHLPCSDSSFEWSEVDSSTQYVVAGDVSSGYILKHRAMILRLCDKGLVSINPKCGAIKTINFRGQLIIVSNVDLKNETLDDAAVQRRFEWVNVDEDAICPKAVPKTEVQEEVLETIYISSSEED